MKFGVKAGEAGPRQAATGTGDFIRYFRDGETRLRFLEEMPEWTEVWMHWSPSKQRNYPCTDDFDTCPGHQSENERESKPAKKYIVNALSDGYINAWMLPGSLWDDLDRFKDKSGGSITDRDYTVVRKNGDQGVRYAVDREERDRIDLSKYDAKKRDIQKMLNDVFVEVWGKEPEAFGNGTVKAHEVAKVIKQPVTPPSWSGSEYQDPPSEPQSAEAPPAEDNDEDRVLTEDELRAMSAPQIKELFRSCGLPAPISDDPAYLADELMKAIGTN